MKKILFVLIAIFFAVACNDLQSDSEIRFYTIGKSFIITDTIQTVLENNSGTDIIVGKNCAGLTTLYYEKKENDGWSDIRYFSASTVECVDFPDTIKAGKIFRYSLLPNNFDTTGTYRLILNKKIPSNSFEIAL